MSRQSHLFVAVVGAGPYGLSIAAHLKKITPDVRVFGRTMDTWQSRMPAGMFLKSEGFASNLSDPDRKATLQAFCEQQHLGYGDYIFQVPIDTFLRYGRAFQQTWVPDVDGRLVRSIEHSIDHFKISLDDGEIVAADNVVIAAGFLHFAYVPPALTGLPKALATHCSDHADFTPFKGREVAIIGAGQSALETAALLREQGCSPHVLLRRPAVEWNRPPVDRSLFENLSKPRTPLGRGRRNWIYSYAPSLFRYLPEARRLDIVRHTLGPAGAWWLKDRVVDKVPLMVGTTVTSAEESGGRVKLNLLQDGATRTLIVDHVIAGTGYQIDIGRLPYLAPNLLGALRQQLQAPVLSPNFESSVPGLYFAGLASAYAFGPIMRFVAGAAPTAHRLERHFRHAARNR